MITRARVFITAARTASIVMPRAEDENSRDIVIYLPIIRITQKRRDRAKWTRERACEIFIASEYSFCNVYFINFFFFFFLVRGSVRFVNF